MEPRQISLLSDVEESRWTPSTRGRSRGTHPKIRAASGALAEATWNAAMDLIARRVDHAIALDGPGAVGFYHSGQLLLEECYTLAKIARAGLGTPNLGAETGSCATTVGGSLMQSFGADGPPGAFEDFDHADCIMLFGHDAAEQSPDLWTRILTTRGGPLHPRLLVVDPRTTRTALGADLHLAPRPGTSLALINGILRLLIERRRVDAAFVEAHTIGFDELCETVAPYTPAEVERITGVPAADLLNAAHWIGASPRVVSTCLHGLDASSQATAVGCAVNTMHLILGKIGRPGCAPFHFAGRPSSMNARECGADGSYPAYRNWANPRHMEELARRWNVPAEVLGVKPVPAPDILQQCIEGQIEVLFVIGTNPAASFVDREPLLRALGRIFVVVCDPFVDAESASFADVYLPTAVWSEKTGCATNAERRCSHVRAAAAPPGEARTDLEILIDLSRRLELTDQSGAPLVSYTDPRGAFEEWRECSRGTIPDYSGMSYELLVARGGVQWPCNDAHPAGTARLYTSPSFPTATERAESFDPDLATGHAHMRREYTALSHDGRARLVTARHEDRS